LSLRPVTIQILLNLTRHAELGIIHSRLVTRRRDDDPSLVPLLGEDVLRPKNHFTVLRSRRLPYPDQDRCRWDELKLCEVLYSEWGFSIWFLAVDRKLETPGVEDKIVFIGSHWLAFSLLVEEEVYRTVPDHAHIVPLCVDRLQRDDDGGCWVEFGLAQFHAKSEDWIVCGGAELRQSTLS
jgi:hypothetical protein